MNADDLIRDLDLAVEKGLVFGYVRGNTIYVESRNGSKVALSTNNLRNNEPFYFIVRESSELYGQLLRQLTLRKKWHSILPAIVSDMFEGEEFTYVHVDPLRLRINVDEVKREDTHEFFRNVKDSRIQPLKTSYAPSRKKNVQFLNRLESAGLRNTMNLNDLVELHESYGISSKTNIFKGSKVTFHLLPDNQIMGSASRTELDDNAHFHIIIIPEKEFVELAANISFSVTTEHEELK